MVRVVRHSKIRVACIASVWRDFFTARREQASRATDIFRFIARESTRRRFTRNASHSLSPGGISPAIACAMSCLGDVYQHVSFFTFLFSSKNLDVGNIALQYFENSFRHPPGTVSSSARWTRTARGGKGGEGERSLRFQSHKLHTFGRNIRGATFRRRQ